MRSGWLRMGAGELLGQRHRDLRRYHRGPGDLRGAERVQLERLWRVLLRLSDGDL